MPKHWTLALALLLAIAPFLPIPPASGHPPGLDNHNSCVASYGNTSLPSSPVTVVGTLSYLSPLGKSLPCGSGPYSPYTFEWGSEAGPCPPPPFVGPVPGAFCGPVVLPGGTATCTWDPVSTTLPTDLIIGFDPINLSLSTLFDGYVNLAAQGDIPVFGPFSKALPPVGWTVPNPYPTNGRVIAFPTNVAAAGTPGYGATSTTDVSVVICVTP